ncbi:hypothetical protein [Veillonella sp. CAG:933]|jgi:hypothetical protein|uniref:hypothetical protein n=1 Tax=Veillonella sp. CAG:933 TaxID=1262980 RepID=UPI00033E4F62|nr:hypothetical protein [Veillonella sp. CAG:933]CCX53259.1 unknown [Veillonella sp. CAG:933]
MDEQEVERILVTKKGEEPKTEPDNETKTESVSLAQVMAAYAAAQMNEKGEQE